MCSSSYSKTPLEQIVILVVAIVIFKVVIFNVESKVELIYCFLQLLVVVVASNGCWHCKLPVNLLYCLLTLFNQLP